MRILVTGAAGFIGFHLCSRLLAEGHRVDGFDGMTPYYDVTLKQARWAQLERHPQFHGKVGMLEDTAALDAFANEPDAIIHLAAQAGVRYSLENPRAYVDSNVVGTFNVMEVARARGVRHFMLASTSSVYGGNAAMPFCETDRADHPLTLYAATKKATEDMAHSYAHLWNIPTTAFRFFTVYGPWGRPDMALFKFVAATLQGQAIDVYGRGEMKRDFTYIDDLVEAAVRLLDKPPRAGAPVGERGFALPRCALPRRQYRGRPAGRADGVHRRHRAGVGAADPAGECSKCRRATSRRPGPRPNCAGVDRLCPRDRRRHRCAGVRRMVSRILPELTQKKKGRLAAPNCLPAEVQRRSETILDLVGPEALEASQRLVHAVEVVGDDAADLLDRHSVLLIEADDDLVDVAAPVGQADADRATVDARAGVVEIAHLDQFLDVVGDVRAEIVAAGAQLAGRQFFIADVIQEQGPARR